MTGLNKVMLLGRLTRDPESRTTANGISLAQFAVAINRTGVAPNGDRRELVEYIGVVAFKELGDRCISALRKGSLVYVEGRLQTRSWESPVGERRVTEVVASDVQFLDRAPVAQVFEFAGEVER